MPRWSVVFLLSTPYNSPSVLERKFPMTTLKWPKKRFSPPRSLIFVMSVSQDDLAQHNNTQLTTSSIVEHILQPKMHTESMKPLENSRETACRAKPHLLQQRWVSSSKWNWSDHYAASNSVAMSRLATEKETHTHTHTHTCKHTKKTKQYFVLNK